jgi:hypothetical protein
MSLNIAVVATSLVTDPTEVHHPVHGAVEDLDGVLVVGEVERGEREGLEVRPARGVAEIAR